MSEAKVTLTAVDAGKAAFDSFKRNVNDVGGQIDGLKGRLAGLAGALALPALFATFNALVNKAGDFQDLSEKVGDTAEAIASLSVAAQVGGASMDDVSAFSIKLTKNLTSVDEESSKTAAALRALGIDAGKFADLRPADQMEALGKALATFEDGAGKTAVLENLAKGGAQLLPFLKELGEEGGRQVILTEEQIRLADEYSDKQKKLGAQISLYAQAIATDFLPAQTALKGAFLDVIKEIGGVQEGTKGLANSSDIKEFANKTVAALAFVGDAADGVYRSILIVGTGIGAAAAAAGAAARGEFALAKNILGQLGGEVDKILQRETVSDKLGRRLAEQANVTLPEEKAKKPRLKFVAPDKEGKDKTAEIAKAQLALDIDAIKRGGDELIAAYANSEKILEALRGAGLIDERQYYESKRGFIKLEAQAKDDALQSEIARYQQEKLTGKDKLENDKKIQTAESALLQLRQKTTAELEVLNIQQEASVKRIARAYEEARLSAQQYFETTGRQYTRELAAFGRGDQARAKAGALNGIDDRFQDQRRELESQKRLLELEGKFTGEARTQYEQRLAIIDEFQGKAVTQWEKYYADLMAMQGNWETGATRALENYVEQAGNIAGQTESLFSNAFKGAEDVLTEFVTKGKGDFKGLVDSIVADLARMAIKQSITGPFADWLKGFMGGGSGGGSGGGNAAGGALSGIGSWLGNLLSFDVGTDYVPQDMVAKIHKGERIIPAAQNKPGAMGGMQLVQHFVVEQGASRQTQQQIAAAAWRGVALAHARNG